MLPTWLIVPFSFSFSLSVSVSLCSLDDYCLKEKKNNYFLTPTQYATLWCG